MLYFSHKNTIVGATEEEKDSTTSSFETAGQGDETAVIDRGAAVIDNKEGKIEEAKETERLSPF